MLSLNELADNHLERRVDVDSFDAGDLDAAVAVVADAAALQGGGGGGEAEAVQDQLGDGRGGAEGRLLNHGAHAEEVWREKKVVKHGLVTVF